MSLNRIPACLLLCSLAVTGAMAQAFTDQGLFSGSGLTLLPTAAIAPPSEFRIQYSRLGYVGGGRIGMNVLGVSAGFSTDVEGYARVTGEQVGTALSQVSYGFGGKLRVPLALPVVRSLALWTEVTMSDRLERGSLYAPDAFRSGVTAEFDSNGVRPSLFLGFARIGDRTGPLAGAGVEVALSHASQIGLEAMHGYLGAGSIQLAATGSFRVIPNVSLHAGPGYLSTPAGSAWSISAGVSLTSLGIDFHPVYDEKKEEEFILPSYEEMEKTRKSVRPPGGDGQNQQEEKRNE